MVGIVFVSHSEKLVTGVLDFCRLMAKECPIAVAGGTPDGDYGTDYGKIKEAIDSVMSPEGVLVIMDLGSSVMTTEMVLDEYSPDKVMMADCPMVEGAVAATVEAEGGSDLITVKKAAEEVREVSKF
jgi:PTS hybrid protein